MAACRFCHSEVEMRKTEELMNGWAAPTLFRARSNGPPAVPKTKGHAGRKGQPF